MIKRYTKKKNPTKSTESNVINDEKSHLLVLPYAGQKGENLVKSTKVTDSQHNSQSAYSASKLGTKFDIKSKTKQDHKHDLTYYAKCPEETCLEDYTGETGRRLYERVIDHNGRDKKSHVLKHCIENDHKLPSIEDFTILGTNYRKNKFRRRISESLFIK